MMFSKGFVLVMILVLVVFLSGVAAIGANVAHGSSADTAMIPEQALNTLMGGNSRFVSGNVLHPNQSDEQQAKVVSGQEPFAVIVSCSDSRVPQKSYSIRE